MTVRQHGQAPALRFTALGDSLTEGLGDRGPDGTWRGWAALLAEALGADFRNLAVSGARTGDVLLTQLPEARRHRPDLAAVVVGGNDTLRAGFDIRIVARQLDTTFGSLALDGSAVLTACLPDPGTALGLPRALARPLARRMRSVNSVVHALSRRYDAVHVHLADAGWTADPEMWSADRLHPGERGHRALALAFHTELAARGFPVGLAPAAEPDGRAPGRAAKAWWLATRGTQWVAARCTDLLPDLVRLAMAERRADPAELDHWAHAETLAALRALPHLTPRPTGAEAGAEGELTLRQAS
ncbi:SGNH/GDSL hydrolase family protein [Streptacidiphilus monticola]|uniref:SGNH/GDSL hydrolase family protein n=1 Tax=Streptacidiphilus monticola TaxID=2161674 RepID=A0ABW1FV72_9ACTN